MKTKLLITLFSLVTASAYAQPSIPVGGMSPPINRSESPVVAGAERAEPNTLSLQFGNVAAKPTPQSVEDPARGTETFADAPQAQPQPGARLLSTAANIYSSKGTQYNPQAQPKPPGQPDVFEGASVGIDIGTTYSATSQAAAPQTREQFENPGNTPQPKSAEKAGQIGSDIKGGVPMP
jgi:hypothetical protein